MYSSIDASLDAMAIDFCTEAEKLWDVEMTNKRDAFMTIAATEFLCLGYLGQGRNHSILSYISDASLMGQRMGLFGLEVQQTTPKTSDAPKDIDKRTRARMYAAWGVFNWLTFVSPLTLSQMLSFS